MISWENPILGLVSPVLQDAQHPQTLVYPCEHRIHLTWCWVWAKCWMFHKKKKVESFTLTSSRLVKNLGNVLTQKILPSICCVGNVKLLCGSLCEQSCLDPQIAVFGAWKKKCFLGASIIPWRPDFISWRVPSILEKESASTNFEHRPGPAVMRKVCLSIVTGARPQLGSVTAAPWPTAAVLCRYIWLAKRSWKHIPAWLMVAVIRQAVKLLSREYCRIVWAVGTLWLVTGACGEMKNIPLLEADLRLNPPIPTLLCSLLSFLFALPFFAP